MLKIHTSFYYFNHAMLRPSKQILKTTKLTLSLLPLQTTIQNTMVLYNFDVEGGGEEAGFRKASRC
jgi:hypothetical protein